MTQHRKDFRKDLLISVFERTTVSSIKVYKKLEEFIVNKTSIMTLFEDVIKTEIRFGNSSPHFEKCLWSREILKNKCFLTDEKELKVHVYRIIKTMNHVGILENIELFKKNFFDYEEALLVLIASILKNEVRDGKNGGLIVYFKIDNQICYLKASRSSGRLYIDVNEVSLSIKVNENYGILF
jgi:hypothetical protein